MLVTSQCGGLTLLFSYTAWAYTCDIYMFFVNDDYKLEKHTQQTQNKHGQKITLTFGELACQFIYSNWNVIFSLYAQKSTVIN